MNTLFSPLSLGSLSLYNRIVVSPMLYGPRWPWHAAAKPGAQVDVPKQYWRAQLRQLKHVFKSG